jgi:hypothetical protein
LASRSYGWQFYAIQRIFSFPRGKNLCALRHVHSQLFKVLAGLHELFTVLHENRLRSVKALGASSNWRCAVPEKLRHLTTLKERPE